MSADPNRGVLMSNRSKVILLIGLIPVIAVTAFPPCMGFNGTSYTPDDRRPFLFASDYGSWRMPNPIRLAVEYTLIASLTAVALLISSFFDTGAARLRAGLCVKCGYDLRETPNRCPECGTVPEGAGAR